jgi:hypothetical protein
LFVVLFLFNIITGVILQDEQTLISYGVEEGSAIFIVPTVKESNITVHVTSVSLIFFFIFF